jgi:hypothetical protein
MMPATQQNGYSMQEVRAVVSKLQWDQNALREAISQSLLTCGEPVMKTVLWHLSKQGIYLSSNDRIDMRLFYDHLEDLIGSGASLVMDEIVDSLVQADRINSGQ